MHRPTALRTSPQCNLDSWTTGDPSTAMTKTLNSGAKVAHPWSESVSCPICYWVAWSLTTPLSIPRNIPTQLEQHVKIDARRTTQNQNTRPRKRALAILNRPLLFEFLHRISWARALTQERALVSRPESCIAPHHTSHLCTISNRLRLHGHRWTDNVKNRV